MPYVIGHIHGPEARLKMRLAKLGKKQTPEQIAKRSEGLMGRKVSNETRYKIGLAQKGRKHSPELIEKQRNGHLGKTQSVESRKKLSEAIKREKHYNWKGGVSKENRLVRRGIEFRLWREAVFARDDWTCQKTGVKGCTLHPHHVQNFAEHPELRFTVNNGVTLSEEAHKEFHRIYGKSNNNAQQLEEFLSLK